jgi:hypothetical protein
MIYWATLGGQRQSRREARSWKTTRKNKDVLEPILSTIGTTREPTSAEVYPG